MKRASNFPARNTPPVPPDRALRDVLHAAFPHRPPAIHSHRALLESRRRRIFGSYDPLLHRIDLYAVDTLTDDALVFTLLHELHHAVGRSGAGDCDEAAADADAQRRLDSLTPCRIQKLAAELRTRATPRLADSRTARSTTAHAPAAHTAAGCASIGASLSLGP